MGQIQKERYLSLVQNDVRGAATAQGRINGLISNFKVAINRPIVGYGLGTSREANYNVMGGYAQPSHNLYVEIFQELGLIGLIIFLIYIKAIITNVLVALKKLKETSQEDSFLISFTNAMQVWLLMNILFSLASYGLSSYEWYLFGGLSVVIKRFSEVESKSENRRSEYYKVENPEHHKILPLEIK